MTMLTPAPLPKWLSRFHALYDLAVRAASLSAEIERNSQRDNPADQTKLADWIAAVDAAALPSRAADEFNKGIESVRAWLTQPAGTQINIHVFYRGLELAERTLEAAAATVFEGRGDDARMLAFISLFYRADLKSPSNQMMLGDIHRALGIAENMVPRLERWAEGEYLLDVGSRTMGGAYYHISQHGRDWFDEQLGHTTDEVVGGPWWMRRDEPDTKWSSSAAASRLTVIENRPSKKRAPNDRCRFSISTSTT